MGMFPVVDGVAGWRLESEPPEPQAAWLQEVLVTTVIDEITGLPPAAAPDASTSTLGLYARASTDGYAGLVGRPLTCWSPGFVTGAPLELTLSGTGYLPLSEAATLGAQPGYPDAFQPVDLGTVSLHRAPLTLLGRVTATGAPLAGAAVAIDGIWTTVASLAGAAAAPNLIALLSPLYANRAVTATVAAQSLTAAPLAQAKTLLRPANVGDTAVRLSDQVGLAVGSIIALYPQDLARIEYATITAITDGGIPPNQPATATLAFPLSRPHAAGQTAIQMILGATGAANTLSQTASVGDVTLFVASMAGLGATMQAVVVSGGAADEYHPAGMYAATSDVDGDVALPPVHRLVQVRLRVHAASEPTDLLPIVLLPFAAERLTLDLAYS